jgi:hypothetical protein
MAYIKNNSHQKCFKIFSFVNCFKTDIYHVCILRIEMNSQEKLIISKEYDANKKKKLIETLVLDFQ